MSMKDFVVLQKLGQGSFATVYKVRRLNDHKIYAMKQIKLNKLDKKSSQNALNQIRFLASFDCPHIITYNQAFFDEQKGLLCIVMEYADNGDLYKNINTKLSKNMKKNQNKKYSNSKLTALNDSEQRFPQIQIWKVLVSLLYGVGYLHDRSIIHRDIKPENIFITKGQYKLGDLNVSRIQDVQQLAKLTQTGTPYYAAPEVWNNQQYDQKTDIWSIGCVIYNMASLKPPFHSNNLQKLYEQVNSCKIKPIPKYYSNQLSQIISMCLRRNSKDRPSIKQLFENWTIKMYNNLLSTASQNDDDGSKKVEKQINLLKTINMPNNRRLLQEKLPKSNYQNQSNIKKSIVDQFQILKEKKSCLQSYHSPLKRKQYKNIYNANQIQNNKISSLVSNCQSEQNLKCLTTQRRQKRRSSPRTQLSTKKSITHISQKQNKQYSNIKQNHNDSVMMKNKDINYKAVILSKLPHSSNNKEKIIQQFLLSAKMSNDKGKSLIKSGKDKLISRKMIFEKVKSYALL